MAFVLESITISVVYASHTDMLGSVVSEGYVVCSQPLTHPGIFLAVHEASDESRGLGRGWE